MRRAPTRSDCVGASPRRVLHADPLRLDLSRSLSKQQELHDWQAIRQLFASGALGGYWTPTLDTLYEDSAGIYQASVGSVIGLWLDRSRTDPVVRRNLITSTSLNTLGSAWSLAPGTTLVDNKLTESSTWSGFALYVYPFGCPAGKYSISMDLKQGGTRFAFLWADNGAGYGHTLEVDLVAATARWTRFNTSNYSDTKYTITPLSDGWMRISITTTTRYTSLQTRVYMSPVAYTSGSYGTPGYYQGTNGNGIYVRNAQIEQGDVSEYQPITTSAEFASENWGNNIKATQPTTANKPYLRLTPTTNLYWVDANTSTAALTATFGSSLGSDCTVARVGPEGVSWLKNQTISTTYNLAPAYGWTGDVLVINRALTDGEKASVTRYMTRKQPLPGNL